MKDPRFENTLYEAKPELLTDAITGGAIHLIPDWFREFARANFDITGWTNIPLQFFPYRYVRTSESRRLHHRLMVIVSGATESEGKRWVHVSFSRPSRVPSYEDLCLVKDRFIGAERQAITVHPPATQHVNMHAYCLHLWHCLDGDGLPDFRVAGQI